MKKLVIFIALAIVAALTIIPVYAEAVDLGDSGDVTLDPDVGEAPADSENAEQFNELMTELYE